jgi:aminopeptidase N
MVRLSHLSHSMVAALLILGSAAAQAEAPFDFATTPGRLPKNVVPAAYRLDLVPDLAALTFTGAEQIDIDVAQPTDKITLDALKLTFSHVALVGEDGAVATVTVDDKAEMASFRFPHPLAVGRHTLDIAYSGVISPQPRGLYYNDFDTAQGRQRMLVTQFEDIHARAMLPSWDEPAFKATFHLTVVLPKSFAAISNTPIETETPTGSDAAGAALKKVSFGQTPKMSSYLLVLCAGPLEHIQTLTKVGDADIRLWAVPGKAQFGRYALNDAAQILPYYNDYFGVRYPLPKLDLIAVPGNFSAGAMENWGGITFIDNDLLFDPASSSPETRENVYLVVAHEMAHQWSGDLVTMAWWDNTWLNEGFASWMEHKATDRFNPSWNDWLRTHQPKEDAMALDARSTSHPIQIKIADESEIGAAFDAISYKKGMALIRMLETYLGEPVFREGMRRYMKEHAYSNTTTADLWAALEIASGKPVLKIAAGFTEQPGIPLIKVEISCDKTDHVATLTQDRFTIHDPDAAKQSWQVPVQIGAVGGHVPRTVLVGDQPETVRLPDCSKPIQANFGDVGYFRVQYDDAALKALVAAYKTLPAANRVTLLADQWALVEAGRAEPGSWLDLTKAIGGETEYAVWTQVLTALREVDDVEHGTPDQAAFQHYAAGMLRPVLERLGWADKPGEANGTVLLRNDLIEALGRFDDDATIAECRKRFDAFLAKPASLSPDIADAVITTVARHADPATWDTLHALGQAASGTEAKLRYYYALAGVRAPALIDKSVAIARTDEISNGRVNRFVIEAAQESGDPDRVWADLLANPDPVLAKLPEDRRGTFLARVASASANPSIATALLARPQVRANAGVRYDAGRAVEQISGRADLRNRLREPIGAWLRANGGA